MLQIQKCVELDEKLTDMEREIAVNPQYVQKVISNSLEAAIVLRNVHLSIGS